MSLPEEIVSLISARLIYKNENDRKDVVNRYLHAMPIEAHGGSEYANICLKQAVKFLQYGKSVNIFPEGAYIPDKKILSDILELAGLFLMQENLEIKLIWYL